jgi:hypothetical protein
VATVLEDVVWAGSKGEALSREASTAAWSIFMA